MTAAARKRPFRLTPYVVPEDDLHQAVADALRVLLPSDAVFTTWEARNAASVIEGARRKRLGLLPGWPDIGVFWRDRTLSETIGRVVVLIELKRERGGALSLAQLALHPRLSAAGFPVAVCHTVDEALNAVVSGGIPLRGRVAA